MTISFHRLTVPSYFGGLPSGYDYINSATATATGTTDVTVGSLYGGGGTLNGLTVILTINGGSTLTFTCTSITAPNLAGFLAALGAMWPGVSFTVNGSNNLVISDTVNGVATILVGAGTANGQLGLTPGMYVSSPANAYGAEQYGPNAGTYFTGFADDGTSGAANRAPNALAANTDYLDNLLHRDIAIIANTGVKISGAIAITLPVGTYLGNAGTTNNAVGLAPYFKTTDSNYNDLIDSSGNQVVPSSLVVTGPDTVGSGSFSVNTVLMELSEVAPRNWICFYGTRSNAASLPVDVITRVLLRGAQEVPFQAAASLQSLHGNGLAWDASWTSTVWDLALSGLDERYNRATAADGSIPAGWPTAITNNTAGAGAWFNRTGPGITGYSQQSIFSPFTSGVGWLAGALFGAINQDGPTSLGGVGASNRLGGETAGFYYLSGRHYTNVDVESSGEYAAGFASFFHGSSVTVNSSGSSSGFKTWLPAGTAVTVSGNSISVTSPAYFALAGSPLNTAISCGYDLVEINFSGVYRQYVITGLTSTTAATIAYKDGSTPVASITGVITRWIRFNMGMFDGATDIRNKLLSSTGGVDLSGFIVAAPPAMLTSSANVFPSGPVSSFFSPDQTSTYKTIAWGGYDAATLSYNVNGYLTGDGSGVFNNGTFVDATVSGELNLLSSAFAFLQGNTTVWGSVNFVGPFAPHIQGTVDITTLTLSTLDSQTMTLQFDGGTVYSVTFTGLSTYHDISSQISAAITGSPQGAAHSNPLSGSPSYLNITDSTVGGSITLGGSALAVLGFIAGTTSGATGAATAVWGANSTATWDAGAAMQLLAGSTTSFAGAATVTGTFSATGAPTGWLTINGLGLAIADGTNPYFVTPRTRAIAQPLICTPTSSATVGFATVSVPDSTPSVGVHITKTINGASLGLITIAASWGSAHTCSIYPAAALYKNDNIAGTTTLVPCTGGSVNTNVGTSAFLFLVPSSLEVINDDQYTYIVSYESSSGGTQPIVWGAPIVSFGDIVSLGQF